MKPKPQKIEDVLEFPCDFTFRVVADADDSIRTVCEAVITEIVSKAPSKTDTKASRKGNFAVYRITVEVASGDQIRQIYQSLVNVEGVRTLL